MPLGRRVQTFRDPRKFAEALRREAELRFPLFCKQVQIATSYEFFRLVTMYTPVLTGRARENWQVTITQPSTRVIDPEQKIQQPGYWFSDTGEPMTDGERAKILPVLQNVMGQPLGRVIYITNKIGYIELLEDGWSLKAPAGMTNISLQLVTNETYRSRIAALANAEVARITGSGP